MPFPISPLAMAAKPLVLESLRGDPSVCLQGLKKTKSCADSMQCVTCRWDSWLSARVHHESFIDPLA